MACLQSSRCSSEWPLAVTCERSACWGMVTMTLHLQDSPVKAVPASTFVYRTHSFIISVLLGE